MSAPWKHPGGKTRRRRLNRRLRWNPRIRDYLARRITEGKIRREAIRCLKRYIVREIYRIITSPPETQPSAA